MADRITAARDYVTKKPTDRFGLYTLAMELRKIQDWTESFSTFDRLLEHHPDNGPGYYHYAMARKESGDLPGALLTVEKGLEVTARTGDGKTHNELRDLKAVLEAGEED
jgi:predicted Zn-dependent protease